MAQETANQKLIRESGLTVPTEIVRLPETYNVDGSFHYKQLERNEHAAIYFDEKKNSYEVFRVKIRKGRLGVIKGKVVVFPTAERVPNDEAFGYWAGHFSSLESAKKRYQEYTEMGKKLKGVPDVDSNEPDGE